MGHSIKFQKKALNRKLRKKIRSWKVIYVPDHFLFIINTYIYISLENRKYDYVIVTNSFVRMT